MDFLGILGLKKQFLWLFSYDRIQKIRRQSNENFAATDHHRNLYRKHLCVIASGYALYTACWIFPTGHGEVHIGRLCMLYGDAGGCDPVLACLCDWYWRRGGHQLFERACGIPQDPQQRFPEWVSDDRSHGLSTTYQNLANVITNQIQTASQSCSVKSRSISAVFYRKDGYAHLWHSRRSHWSFAVSDQ